MPTSTTPATTTTMPFIAITGPSGEFYSPSRNINCEIAYTQSGSQALNNGTYCQTDNPPQAVVLNPFGQLKTCTGQDCLGNAGVNTPVLEYGTATGAGPFRCVSQTTGMTCTVSGGQGFSIATAGITPLGGATVVAHGTSSAVIQP